MKIGNHGYEAKILVGFTKSGELLLYDIIDMIPKTIIIKKGTNTVPVHQNGGSNSSQNVPSGTIIPQSTHNSNTPEENTLEGSKSKDDTIYLSAVERGDMETAQRMVDEAANDFAGWGLTRDMQVRYNDTAVIRLPFINERI